MTHTEPHALPNVISVEAAQTLDGLFRERVKRSPHKEAYRYFNWISEQWSS